MSDVFATARQRHAVLVDAMRSRLWPVPAVGVAAAVLLGVVLPDLDAAVDQHMPPTLAGYLFGGTPDGAREVLAAIATSLMTVTSLTFSLTLVTLQLASSQYSPRLLRTFAADRFVQRTLALFLATFAYALTVLRTVRSATDQSGVFVPRISVTVAYLLATASVLALVLFLGHLVRQIRIETMLDHVSSDVVHTVSRTSVALDEESADAPKRPPLSGVDVIVANSSGFLVQVDEAALVDAAVRAEAVVWVDRPVGGAVVANVPVARCAGEAGGRVDEGRIGSLRARVAAALHTGVERTATQDVGYGLRQLTDVAVRALSPGINDPTTAVHALNSSATVLCELAGYRLGPKVLRDENDTIRVVLARPDLPDLLDLVCTQPQIYGAKDPMVMGSLLALLRDVAWVVRIPAHRLAIAHRCERMRQRIARQGFDAAERGELDLLLGQVHGTLDRRWIPSSPPPPSSDAAPA